MADGDVSAAWSRYRESIEQIYELPAGIIVESRDARIREPPGGDLIERALVRSDELRAVILAELLSNDSGVRRELAMTQLGAAATIDLSIADDLARLEPAETDPPEFAELDAPSLTNTFAAAAVILEASGEDPWEPILAGGAEPPGGPREALELQTRSVTKSIIDDTHKVVMSATNGLSGMAAGYLVVAVSVPTEDIFHDLAHRVGRIRRAAINFVLGGIKKLLASLGVDADLIRHGVTQFVELQARAVVRKALTTLYDSNSIERDLVCRIANAPSEQAMAPAEVKLADLRRRFTKQMEVTDGTVHALNKVRRWLFHVAPPYSHIAVTAAYVIATGFAVSAGGDYLDWGPIDFVPGVQAIVRNAT
jgi:hypothetical protein